MPPPLTYQDLPAIPRGGPRLDANGLPVVPRGAPAQLPAQLRQSMGDPQLRSKLLLELAIGAGALPDRATYQPVAQEALAGWVGSSSQSLQGDYLTDRLLDVYARLPAFERPGRMPVLHRLMGQLGGGGGRKRHATRRRGRGGRRATTRRRR